MQKSLPVSVDGKIVHVSRSSIARNNWTKHSGQTAAGATVASLKSQTIGATTIIGQGSNMFSATTDEFEVFARDLLGNLGYEIKAPKST